MEIFGVKFVVILICLGAPTKFLYANCLVVLEITNNYTKNDMTQQKFHELYLSLNFIPASIPLRSANRKRLLGALSGEYGELGSNSYPNPCKFSIVSIDLSHGALS